MAVSATRTKRRELSLEAAGLAISPLNKAHRKVLADQYQLIEDLKVEIESTFVDFTAPSGSRLDSFRQYSNIKMSGMITNQNLFQLMEFSGLKNSRELYDLNPVTDPDGNPVKIYAIKQDAVKIFIRTTKLINGGTGSPSYRHEATSGDTEGTGATEYTVYSVGQTADFSSGDPIDPTLLNDAYKVYTKNTIYTTATFPTTGTDPIPFSTLNRSWQATTEFGANKNQRMSGIVINLFNDACQPIGTTYAAQHRLVSLAANSDDLPPGETEARSVSVFDIFGEETRGLTLSEVKALIPINSYMSFGQFADLNKTCDDIFSASMIYSTQLSNGKKVNYEILLPVAKFKTTNIPLGPSAKEQVKTSFEIQLNPIDATSLGDEDYLIKDTIFQALAANDKNPHVIIKESTVPCTCK